MEDRLVWLLNRFELRAGVFQAGPVSGGGTHEGRDGVGYLHVLESGRVSVTMPDGQVTEIDEPCAFFFMNPVTHRLQILGDRASLVCATFEFGLGEGNPLQKALPDMFVLRLEEAPELGSTIEQLFTEAAGDHCGRQAILDRLCEVALILILRDLMDRERLNVGLLAGLADRRLAKAINAIHATPAEGWTVESLASAAGMSRARFAARFREVVGMTPGAYLGEWRLGLAQTMLLEGSPVNTIAGDVGYGSASALSRVFATRCGMSPTEWLRSRRM